MMGSPPPPHGQMHDGSRDCPRDPPLGPPLGPLLDPPLGSMHDPLHALPHREPFVFITRVVRCMPGEACAEWHVTGAEDFFRGHFPGNPIVPGVLIGEALAQTAGVALGAEGDGMMSDGALGGGATGDGAPEGGATGAGFAHAHGVLARIELRFHAAMRPPAVIELTATRTGKMGRLHQFDVAAVCAGERVAHGSLVLAVG